VTRLNNRDRVRLRWLFAIFSSLPLDQIVGTGISGTHKQSSGTLLPTPT
jgi:hypothetical protein